ncbi:hypothetical protein AB1Y20_020371 [Prymnesium parvum]|uniref:Triple QxxK/R motif-containing protein n=1 Tax=Prymnesium parvum TaxID=97485 RepID=A0AB34JV33_PRYPA
MGKTRAVEPPAADYRRKTGRFHAKVGKAELKDTESRALARRQDSEMIKVLIGLIVFAIFSCLLYLYLSYAVAEEDEPLEDGARQ